MTNDEKTPSAVPLLFAVLLYHYFAIYSIGGNSFQTTNTHREIFLFSVFHRFLCAKTKVEEQ